MYLWMFKCEGMITDYGEVNTLEANLQLKIKVHKVSCLCILHFQNLKYTTLQDVLIWHGFCFWNDIHMELFIDF